MITCPNCGTSNEDGAAFCANCGTSLNANAGSNQPDLTSVAYKAQEWNNKFLSFLKPFLQTIDNGSFFRRVFGWLYLIIAILNIIAPLYLLFKLIEWDLFKAEGKMVISILIIWFVIAILGWFGFQLWWDRRNKVTQATYSGAEFVATPVVAHFIQTIGEWYGILIGVIGFVMAFVTLLFGTGGGYYGGYNDYEDAFFNLPYVYNGSGWLMMFTAPVTGFLIVVFFRFIAETIKALASIANNTRQR
jgi:zinc-ribbon domain